MLRFQTISLEIILKLHFIILTQGISFVWILLFMIIYCSDIFKYFQPEGRNLSEGVRDVSLVYNAMESWLDLIIDHAMTPLIKDSQGVSVVS